MPRKSEKPPFRGTPAIKTPQYDGSAGWYVETAGRIAKAMCRDPINRDLHAVARAFASLATAARGFINRDEVDAVIADLKKQVTEMLKASEHGQTFVGAADLRAAANNDAGEPVH